MGVRVWEREMDRKSRRWILAVLVLMSLAFVYIESEHLTHVSKHSRTSELPSNSQPSSPQNGAGPSFCEAPCGC